MSRYQQGYLIPISVSSSRENPREHILFFDETALGLPSKKMYYRESAQKTREAYIALMRNLTLLYAQDLKVTVPSDLEDQLQEILTFEAEIANVSSSAFNVLLVLIN